MSCVSSDERVRLLTTTAHIDADRARRSGQLQLLDVWDRDREQPLQMRVLRRFQSVQGVLQVCLGPLNRTLCSGIDFALPVQPGPRDPPVTRILSRSRQERETKRRLRERGIWEWELGNTHHAAYKLRRGVL